MIKLCKRFLSIWNFIFWSFDWRKLQYHVNRTHPKKIPERKSSELFSWKFDSGSNSFINFIWIIQGDCKVCIYLSQMHGLLLQRIYLIPGLLGFTLLIYIKLLTRTKFNNYLCLTLSVLMEFMERPSGNGDPRTKIIANSFLCISS